MDDLIEKIERMGMDDVFLYGADESLTAIELKALVSRVKELEEINRLAIEQVHNAIAEAVNSYTCQYACEFDDSGSGMRLVDILTSSGQTSITPGQEEVLLLIDAIQGDVDDAIHSVLDAGAASVSGKEIVERIENLKSYANPKDDPHGCTPTWNAALDKAIAAVFIESLHEHGRKEEISNEP